MNLLEISKFLSLASGITTIGLLLAIADEAQGNLLVGPHGRYLGAQLTERADGLAIYADDDVAGLDARLGGGGVRHDLVDEGTILLVVAEGLGDL